MNRFEFEVESPPGTLIARQEVAVNRASSTTLVSWYAPSPPDAGLHWWRVRALDTADAGSPWMEWESFRIDDTVPGYPSTITLDAQDGGWLALSCEALTDPQSGIGAYHWMLGQLDSPDGGPGASFSGPTSSGPARQFRLGPGRWHLGVHTHDAVGNGLSSTALWVPVTVPPATLGAPPALVVTQANGTPWPNAPYQNVNRAYFRFPPQAFDAGAYTVLQSLADSGVWGFSVDSTSATANVYENDGRYEFRYVALLGGEATEYSEPVFVWVDAARPQAPALLDAGLSGGVVSLAWASALDANPTTTGSGVASYDVVRTAGDASVALATVPSASPLTLTDTPPPGRWTYSVFSRDRALNQSASAGRYAVSIAPGAPDAPVPDALVTDAAVTLTWTWSGESAEFELDRLDADGGVTAVQLALPAATFTDAPPEGRWRYVARGVVRGAPGPDSAPSALVTVDQSGPLIDAPGVSRSGAREVEVTWSATDALSSVAAATIERDTGGAVTPLGAATGSAHRDAPPDGTHRYRVLATDVVGNMGASPWSRPIDTPGASVDVVEVPAGQCGRALLLPLTASGAASVTWALAEGPATAALDPLTGELSWTPTRDEVGPHAFRVVAQGASSQDELRFTVEVACTQKVLTLGCAAADAAALLPALAATLLLRRRRR